MPLYGLKFRTLGQTSYHSGPDSLRPGDQVIIAAEQGEALAEVVSGPHESLPAPYADAAQAILRPATAEDRERARSNAVLAQEAAAFCRQCIRQRRLDMKLVEVEVYFDRSKFIFYFTAPARIDFRELVKDLVREYRARIELRQIGVRHETQMVGAVGNCGMVCCCRRYLRKFAPVTIRMAKEQNLFLNPAKISSIDLGDGTDKIKVYMLPDEVKKGIGKGGCNIKLASMLVGREIEVWRELPKQEEEGEEDVLLSEFSNEIDQWIIDKLQSIGCDTAKSVLALSESDIAKRADLEDETVAEVFRILRAEFED